MSKKIWYAFVHVKAAKNNKSLDGAMGAFVNVAYRASSKKDLLDVIDDTFKKSDFKILSVEDVSILSTKSADTPEKLSLLKDVESEYDYSWGDFHTYDRIT